MKNFRLTLLALLLVCGSACSQKELILEETPIPDSAKTITASFANANTKVSYSENPETHKLHQEWEVGDMLFGFDDNSSPLTLTVTAVDGESGVATLEVENGDLPASGSIHMIYTGDRTGTNLTFNDGLPCFVNISEQVVATGTTVPAILTADAAVTTSGIHLVFDNQTAVLGIKGFHGLPAECNVVSFFVDGVENYASISLENGKLKLTTADNPYLQGSVFVEKTGGWTADAAGKVDDVFYVAVFPNAQASDIRLSAYDDQDAMYVNLLGSKNIAAGKYYYMNDKVLSSPVATVSYTSTTISCFSFDEAIATANAAPEDCVILLEKDCAPASAVNITNEVASIVLELNGHTLTLGEYGITMAAENANLTISDTAEQKGEILENGEDTDLLCVEAGVLYVSGVTLHSTCNNPILRQLGGDISFFDATLTHEHAGTILILCEDGFLSFYNTVVEQKNADGNVLLSVYKPYNEQRGIYIGENSSFIQAGNANLINVSGDFPQDSECITIDGANFWQNTSSDKFMVFSTNSGVISVNSAHFNRPSQYACNSKCTLLGNQSIVKIYPSITVNGKTYDYRTISRTNSDDNIWAYRNDIEAYVSYSVGEGKRLYPAQTNITYQTTYWGIWAFRSSAYGYSTDYNPDLISLFTWGLGYWSVIPDETDFLSNAEAGETLTPERDWGAMMDAGPCRVPTKEEWDYLLTERPASTVNGVENARFVKCLILLDGGFSYGLLLFPDEFSWPDNAGLPPDAEAINNLEDPYSTAIDESYFSKLTQLGCVFLQADGYRTGSTINDNNHLGMGDEASGNYWSSTMSDHESNPYFMNFSQDGMSPSTYTGSANNGFSVRLFLE